MKKTAQWLLALVLLSVCVEAAPDNQWGVPDAPYRVLVRLRKAASRPECGVEINLPEFGLTRPDLSDLLLLGPDNKPVPIAKIGRLPGNRTLILAQKLDPDVHYFLYFGGDNIRNSPEWTPEVSLLMRTKPLSKKLGFDSVQELKATWAESKEEPGSLFADRIFHGGNPFGPNTQFLTKYTGYLNLPQEQEITFYTLSSDCSFVFINDQLQLEWPGRHSPRAFPDTVPQKAVRCPAGLVKIEYWAAKGELDASQRLEASMVLGWKNSKGVYETIPPEAWIHAGSATVSPIIRSDRLFLPVPYASVESFAGYGNYWFHEVAFGLGPIQPSHRPAQVSPGWSATWEFPDGSTISQNGGRRLLSGLESQLVKCKLTREQETLEMVLRIDIPDKLQRASINDPKDVRRLVDLIQKEKVSTPDSIRPRLAFLVEFGTDQDVAQFASQIPEELENPLWVSARLASIRILAQKDPAQAHQELTHLTQLLSPEIRKNFSNDLAYTEMDLLVFCSRDPEAFGRLSQIAFLNNATNVGRTAKVRTGDLHRLLGQIKEAVAQYKPLSDTSRPKALPAKDRAESLAVCDLLDKGLPREAYIRLREWEMRHPLTKFESDFLLLNARTLITLGRYSEAQAELESFQKTQPDSPFQIDAQFHLARILFEKGSKDEARKIWNQIASDYPKHPLAKECKLWAAKP